MVQDRQVEAVLVLLERVLLERQDRQVEAVLVLLERVANACERIADHVVRALEGTEQAVKEQAVKDALLVDMDTLAESEGGLDISDVWPEEEYRRYYNKGLADGLARARREASDARQARR